MPEKNNAAGWLITNKWLRKFCHNILKPKVFIKYLVPVGWVFLLPGVQWWSSALGILPHKNHDSTPWRSRP